MAIARAILKNSAIVLLDEATSAVDTETEQMIQGALQRLCRGRTTLVIAHRLSTIMKADQILVIMDGEVVESGTHNELIKAKGKYHGLWSKQFDNTPANGVDGQDISNDRDTILIDDVGGISGLAGIENIGESKEVQVSTGNKQEENAPTSRQADSYTVIKRSSVSLAEVSQIAQ